MASEASAATGHAAGGLGYLPALDGIRGLAVAAVLLFHGGALGGGFLGVDAFFVLSGFLITSLLLVEVRGSGRVDFRAFWMRRARRLLPALFVTLLGVVVFAALFASTGDLARIRDDALATLGYAANWNAIAQDHGYWSLFQAPSPLEHTWSLAIEEQFYLVWPLLVAALAFVARRIPGRRSATRPGRWLFALSGLLVALSVYQLVRLYVPGADPSRVYLGTDTRIASILVGAALAALLAWRGPVRSGAGRTVLEVLAVVAISGLAVAWATVDGQGEFLYRGGLLACAFAVAAVIASAAHPRPGPVARLLAVRPLRALGIISYGLYLWHWPVYVTLTEERTRLGGDALLGTRIGVSLALATVSYLLVERPIRRRTFSVRQVLVTATATATVCVIALLGVTSRATEPVVATSPFVPQRVEPVARTDASLLAAAQRRPGAPGTRLLIVGDSVAKSIATAALAVQGDFGLQVRDSTVNGCMISSSIDGVRYWTGGGRLPASEFLECRGFWTRAAHTFMPSTVILIYGSGAGFVDVSVDGAWTNPCDGTFTSWYESNLRFSLAGMIRDDVRVHLARLPHLSSSTDARDSDARIDCINGVHDRVAESLANVTILDLAGFVCPANECKQSYAGEKYRFDGVHYTLEASVEVARWMLDDVMRTTALERVGALRIQTAYW